MRACGQAVTEEAMAEEAPSRSFRLANLERENPPRKRKVQDLSLTGLRLRSWAPIIRITSGLADPTKGPGQQWCKEDIFWEFR